MSKFFSFAGKAARWLGGGLVGFVVGVYVLAAALMLFWTTYFMWGPYRCNSASLTLMFGLGTS
jgi:hypothetical protein